MHDPLTAAAAFAREVHLGRIDLDELVRSLSPEEQGEVAARLLADCGQRTFDAFLERMEKADGIDFAKLMLEHFAYDDEDLEDIVFRWLAVKEVAAGRDTPTKPKLTLHNPEPPAEGGGE